MGNEQNYKKRMIGIDGGGSKTDFILFDEDGNILERLILSACNPNSIGIKGCLEILIHGIEQLRQTSPHIQGIFIGCAGFKSGGNGEAINNLLNKKYPHIKIKCDTDIANVFAAAQVQEPCIAGICGTGTVVYLLQNGTLTQYTGWGYLLDTGGSGFHIGRDGIVAALEAIEGLGDATCLTSLIEGRLGGPVKENIRTLYTNNATSIASFAPCVFDAYRQGDKKAKMILESNAGRLADVINRVAGSISVKKVLLSGSVVTGNDVFLNMLKCCLKPGMEIVLPKLSQAQGACILCAEFCGLDAEKIRVAFKNQSHKEDSI